jgi:diaminohydroxyphosphoribosylaminopyrimidine deaminase/5-amino-6-(5-phosphoribosylamino)uracil reductase
MAACGPLAELSQAAELRFHRIERVGDDLRILARPAA